MKRLLFYALLLVPSVARATYIPVNGSTVTVAPYGGGSVFTVGTHAVTSASGFTTTPGSGTWQVSLSTNITNGVGGSTTAVVNANGQHLNVNIAAAGINQNVNVTNPSTMTVYQSGVWGATVTFNGTQAVTISTNIVAGVAGSTVAVTNANGQNLNVNIAASGLNLNVNATNPSTATVYQAGVWGATTTYNGQQAVLVATMQVIQNGGGQGSVGYAAGDSSFPVNVTNSITVLDVTTGTTNTALPGVAALIGFNGPTGNIESGRVTKSSEIYVDDLIDPSSNTVTVGSTPTIQGFSPPGITVQGNGVPQSLFVTSTTIPATRADATAAYWSGSNIGQGLVTGVPFGLISSTYSTTVSSQEFNGTSYAILVASPAAGSYTYLCGCIFTNTTATNNAIILQSPTNTVTDSIAIGAPANFVSGGLWPGCENPFYRSAAGSQIAIYQTATVAASAAIYSKCIYYTGP